MPDKSKPSNGIMALATRLGTSKSKKNLAMEETKWDKMCVRMLLVPAQARERALSTCRVQLGADPRKRAMRTRSACLSIVYRVPCCDACA